MTYREVLGLYKRAAEYIPASQRGYTPAVASDGKSQARTKRGLPLYTFLLNNGEVVTGTERDIQRWRRREAMSLARQGRPVRTGTTRPNNGGRSRKQSRRPGDLERDRYYAAREGRSTTSRPSTSRPSTRQTASRTSSPATTRPTSTTSTRQVSPQSQRPGDVLRARYYAAREGTPTTATTAAPRTPATTVPARQSTAQVPAKSQGTSSSTWLGRAWDEVFGKLKQMTIPDDNIQDPRDEYLRRAEAYMKSLQPKTAPKETSSPFSLKGTWLDRAGKYVGNLVGSWFDDAGKLIGSWFDRGPRPMTILGGKVADPRDPYRRRADAYMKQLNANTKPEPAGLKPSFWDDVSNGANNVLSGLKNIF